MQPNLHHPPDGFDIDTSRPWTRNERRHWSRIQCPDLTKVVVERSTADCSTVPQCLCRRNLKTIVGHQFTAFRPGYAPASLAPTQTITVDCRLRWLNRLSLASRQGKYGRDGENGDLSIVQHDPRYHTSGRIQSSALQSCRSAFHHLHPFADRPDHTVDRSAALRNAWPPLGLTEPTNLTPSAEAHPPVTPCRCLSAPAGVGRGLGPSRSGR